MKCTNNIKQMSLGTINAADTNQGNLPPSVGLWPGPGTPSAGQSDGGLHLHILPYIEQDNLYKASSVTPEPNDRNGGQQTYSQWTPVIQNARVPTYICPSDGTQRGGEGGRTSYAHNGQVFKDNYRWGSNGLATFPASLGDGTSNTIMFTEKLAHCNSGDRADNFWPDWGPVTASSDIGYQFIGPTAIPQFQVPGNPGVCDDKRASSKHTGGIVVGMFDGSVRTVSPSVSGVTWWAAMTPSGGETFNW